MTGRKFIIRALAAIASATVAVGLVPIANATPVAPCADVPYVGVCVPVSEQPTPPTQQSLGEVAVPSDGGSGVNFVN
ncbi:hypothetical protein [Mycobacterium sp.]|uniref:hypothetical protein n=1 Tax=Mycobacterium sp. TaxID=1785 RepID=UPI002C60DD99|nr:hypothetical protein [Mycobacterium sp.]HKP42810.1 hypothetical protein [Mycobacterium sp.]